MDIVIHIISFLFPKQTSIFQSLFVYIGTPLNCDKAVVWLKDISLAQFIPQGFRTKEIKTLF